jgi:Tfp pilus assembly protein PilO
MSLNKSRLLRADMAGVLALLCMTGAAYFGGLEPMMQARQARASLLSQIDTQRSEGLELGATIAMLRRQRDALLADLESSARRLHPITRQNERLAAITALASETGLVVDEVHPEQAQFGPRYGKMPVRIHARGDYGKCTMFLHRLAEYPDLGVQSLRLLGSPSDAGQTPVLIVELVWYVLPPERRS